MGLLWMPIPEQDQQLACGEPRAGVRALRPPGAPALGEALRTQPEALPVLAQELACGPGAIAADKDRATERRLQESPATHRR